MGSVIKSLSKERYKTAKSLCRNGFGVSKTHSHSIVETAKANDLEPYDYLLRVFSLLPGKGKSPSHEELERLMPWHPDVQGREVLRKRKT